MGQEGFSTLRSGEVMSYSLPRVWQRLLGVRGTAGTVGEDRTQEGARRCKALPCSELVTKEEKPRDTSQGWVSSAPPLPAHLAPRFSCGGSQRELKEVGGKG